MATKNHEGEWVIPDEGDAGGQEAGRAGRLAEIRALAAAGALEAPAGAEEIVEALAEVIRERDEMLGRAQRAVADFQNFQRRAANNEREARELGVRGVVERVLTVVDHFDMALGVDASRASAEQVIGGVRVIRDELLGVLGGFGVRKIEPALGEEFRPSEHEAMMRVPTRERAAGTVAMVMGVGYRLGERVVRPAKVGVAVEADAGA
jgi:molecular chaperone GrpE